ncbi:hypothetical protein TPAR_03643 [Tolypocladium paradoxum]|uniref:Uncharacterized protein n=1 Tax=Tolypocladium paradoxum TaxID=94208 RepID=A0A2S4L145_9HYPO|nr:hypothetical protein TPAR_03643 [Tolypocladium paradoxum]
MKISTALGTIFIGLVTAREQPVYDPSPRPQNSPTSGSGSAQMQPVEFGNYLNDNRAVIEEWISSYLFANGWDIRRLRSELQFVKGPYGSYEWLEKSRV